MPSYRAWRQGAVKHDNLEPDEYEVGDTVLVISGIEVPSVEEKFTVKEVIPDEDGWFAMFRMEDGTILRSTDGKAVGLEDGEDLRVVRTHRKVE